MILSMMINVSVMEKQIDSKLMKRVLGFQRDEITSSLLYIYFASKQKDENNRKVFLQFSAVENKHYLLWKNVTGQDVKPKKWKIFIFKIVSIIFGYTFAIRYFENGEMLGIKELKNIEGKISQASLIIADEEEHENYLMNLLDEERLHYIGSMVLGLNDALVELTVAIAGLTFALANTRMVALVGIITGISATLSMAASNYLAERSDGNENALKSSFYIGAAYLITVALMVLPYLLLPNSLYALAFAIMLGIVIFIIFFFTYYISVARNQKFFKRFLEMAVISLSVALISFLIGLATKSLLGVDA